MAPTDNTDNTGWPGSYWILQSASLRRLENWLSILAGFAFGMVTSAAVVLVMTLLGR